MKNPKRVLEFFNLQFLVLDPTRPIKFLPGVLITISVLELYWTYWNQHGSSQTNRFPQTFAENLQSSISRVTSNASNTIPIRSDVPTYVGIVGTYVLESHRTYCKMIPFNLE